MSVSSWIVRRMLGAAVLGSTLVVAAPAAAGVIGSFDPLFGPSIPNLGFQGSITLDVSQGCYSAGPGFQFTSGTCQITAQSAQINFYNATTNSGTLSTVNLGPGSFGSGYVRGAYIDATGAFAGLDTNDSALFPVSVRDPMTTTGSAGFLSPSVTVGPYPSIAYTGSMLLYFISGFEPSEAVSFRAASSDATSLVIGFGGAFLVDCNGSDGRCTRDSGTRSNPASLTFTAVPEPASVSLGLLGAVALAAMRRRGRRSAGQPRPV